MSRPWLLALLLLPLWGAAAERSDAWQALRDGRAVLLMRHATAPGTGDPANFRLGQCETQRNLMWDTNKGSFVQIKCHPINKVSSF